MDISAEVARLRALVDHLFQRLGIEQPAAPAPAPVADDGAPSADAAAPADC